MKILILEDDENRIKKFKENFIGCELFITHLPTQAITWLKEMEFDHIFLDHDLSEEHYQTWQNPSIAHENTGYEVAKFIRENPRINEFTPIIIHSLNPHGSERMLQACGKWKTHCIPFTVLFDRLRIKTNEM